MNQPCTTCGNPNHSYCSTNNENGAKFIIGHKELQSKWFDRQMKTRDGEIIVGWGVGSDGRPYAHINDGYGYGGKSMYYSNISNDGPGMIMNSIKEWRESLKKVCDPVYYDFNPLD